MADTKGDDADMTLRFNIVSMVFPITGPNPKDTSVESICDQIFNWIKTGSSKGST